MNKTATGKPQLATVGDMAPGVDSTLTRLGEIILGKERQLQLALACLLARGHLLIEDLPGVGKTTLAHGLAAVCLLYTSDAADEVSPV